MTGWYNRDDNVIITGTDDRDDITNFGSNVTINALGEDDYIYNIDSSVIIDAGDGNDSVASYRENVTINGGTGNDTITQHDGSNVIIDGGAGNDYIESHDASNVSLNGGAGNDYIATFYSTYDNANITLNGGAGNDTLTGSYGKDTFVHESGNDVITNYSGEDTVYIATGRIDSYSFSGSDLIFRIGNDSLTLKSMKNHAITVKDSSGNTSTKIYGTGYSGAEVMKNFVYFMTNSSITTIQKVDEAIKYCSQFNSVQDVINHLLSDLRKAGDADTFLRDYCGIFLDNADTGAVTGWDAGGLTVKTTRDLFPTSYSDAYPPSTSFTKRGLTITVPERSTLTEAEQNVVRALYTADVEDSLKLIEETYGVSFTNKPLTIPLHFAYQPDAFGAAWVGIGLTINMSKGSPSADIISHELTHVAQSHFGFNSYTNSGSMSLMVEGMADVTAGRDSSRDYKELAEDPAKLAQYLNLNNTFHDDSNVYAAGRIFWRYLMRQAADNYDSTASNAWENNVNIQGTGNGSTISAGGTSTSTTTGGGSSTSTVNNNQFVYTGGNQIVSNYAGEKIVFGDMYTGATFDGIGNFFVGSATGTLAIENATDKVVDIVDANGNAFIKAYTPSTAGIIDGRGLTGFEIINGSSEGTDVIFAGDGGSSLWGGAGDITDALVGGNGTDIFSGGRFQGSDNFYNVSSSDIVNLTDVSLSNIVLAGELAGNVLIGFNTGNIISIQSTDTLSAAINLADGSAWRFNHATKAWQSA